MRTNRIGKNISILQRQANHFFNESLRPYCINKSQMDVLLLLSRKDGLSQSELNEGFFFNKGSITKLLKSLEALDYVKRSPSKEDKRKNLVYLTPKAKEVLPAIRNAIFEWEAKITKGLTEQEQEIVKLLLNKIIDSILEERR